MVLDAASPQADGAPLHVDIAILGGGLGGLALAAGLRRRGFDAHVFEGAPRLRKETGTMIGLGANAFQALSELHPDLPDDLRSRGVNITRTLIRNLLPGQPPKETVREDFSGLTTIRWAEAHDALARCVPPEVIHLGHQAEGYTEVWEGGQEGGQPGGGPASHAVVRFARGRPPVTAQLVVACDGVFSAVRAAMVPTDPGPRYLGHMNWNCVQPNPGGNTLAPAHSPAELVFASDSEFGSPVEPSIMMYISDAGGGYTFWQVRLRYDEPTFTAQPDPQQPDGGQQPQNGHQQEGGKEQQPAAGGDHGAQGKQGATKADDDPQGGDGVGWRRGRGGMGVAGSKARIVEKLESLGWEFALPIIRATPESAIFERALYDRLPLRRWASPGERVVLMGDAAHAMHPGPGQGARSAFEDAHQLVLAMEAHWPDVGAVLQRYQDARVVRAARIQTAASESCGLPAIQEAARPAGLSPADRMERFREMLAWFSQYPSNAAGDPGSKWWQPLDAEGEERLLTRGWPEGGAA